MKLLWFHLMPYTDLPDDFAEAHRVGLGRHRLARCSTRARRTSMYNEFLDELEYAAEVGFDGICVNEHHQNGYGLMPSPNLIAAGLARRTSDAALVRDGQLARALQPADARRRGVRDARLHLGRTARRRLPGRHADGHLLRLRPEPEPAARALLRGARPDHAGVDGRRAVHLQRPLQPAALREPVAAPDAEAAPADLDPGRRLGRDLALVRARRTTSTPTSRTSATSSARRR